MVVQPYVDPGYGMPNAFVGNLNQAPGLDVGGWLRANALQGPSSAAPNSNNPLAQASSWADAAQSVAGTVGAGVDRLTQWLAEQRAKMQRLTPYAEMIANMPPNTARVPPDTMSDVNPAAGFAPVDIGQEVTSPIYPQGPDAIMALLNRGARLDSSGATNRDADAILQGMMRRRALGRSE
jgi:hypothetical protein